MWNEIKQIAQSYAEEFCSNAIYPSHLFKAILHREVGLVHFVEVELNKDYYYLQEWADIQMQLSPRASKPVRELEYAQEAESVLEEALSYQQKFELSGEEPVCVLASLVTPGVGFSFEQLKTLPLSVTDICDVMAVKTVGTVTGMPHKGGFTVSGKGAIGKYCVSKLDEVAHGRVGAIVGFEAEIAIIYEILGRKTKSNLLIVGETGVGKTALVNGFTLQLIEGNVPSFLKGAHPYELDLATLSSDASYKGEVEDRFKSVIRELKEIENAILIIESVDKLMDKQSPLFGISTLLKQELDRGNLLLICTASVDGFTKYIETDREFVSKLEKVLLEEPSADHCLRILKRAIHTYETYHQLTIDESVLVDSIRLAKRYLNEKALPDSAFDLIDRTMALVKTMNDMSAKEITSLEEKLDELIAREKDNTPSQFMQELTWLHYELLSKVSCVLLAQLDHEIDFSKLSVARERIDCLKWMLNQLRKLSEQKRKALDGSDLYAVVAKQTGIPLGKVQSKERDKLTHAEATLKRRVVGQDHAIKIIMDAVLESRSGLNKKGQPMGSFFFLGPTGTGKTELSKALAEFLFEEESSLLRFDMSEFKEEHSVALLYGAPPGYVGYEEGGLLVNKIRQKPYSVVLFDEIEKAHKSVFDLFLQILDEGKLHDRLGRVGDFSNALILFTSNIGSDFITQSFGRGVIPANNDLMNIMQNQFRPEFLGRLTEIVPFAPITEDTVTRIFDIHLKGLYKLLEEQQITLLIAPEVKREIAMRGYNPQFGARPIIGIIRKELRRPLSKLIIAGKIKAGDTVELCLTGGGSDFVVK